MKKGFLKEKFKGVAVKRLVAGEIDKVVSNQHEFNVNKSLLQLFGKPEGKVRYNTKFLYLSDNIDEQKEIDNILTWYDARERHPSRSEYRLYFPADAASVIGLSEADDSLFLCLKSDNTLLLIIAKQESTIESQLYYLFGLNPAPGSVFESNLAFENSDKQISIVVRTIFEKIGIEYEEDSDKLLFENLIDRFDGKFPSTDVFSKYARETVKDANPIEAPDETLVRWFEHETVLFKMMERHIIKTRLKEGFVNGDDVDVEGFLKFSLSVQNRRKARAGMALENSITEILSRNDILFDRTPVTERRNKPDFLFPGKSEYHDSKFPADLLTMLGAKTTSKDRWRQVLDEADRIKQKHLITLEPSISTNQTDQMQSRLLQLVVPLPIQNSYTPNQQKWLFSVADFLKLVKERQRRSAQFSDIILLYFDTSIP